MTGTAHADEAAQGTHDLLLTPLPLIDVLAGTTTPCMTRGSPNNGTRKSPARWAAARRCSTCSESSPWN